MEYETPDQATDPRVRTRERESDFVAKQNIEEAAKRASAVYGLLGGG